MDRPHGNKGRKPATAIPQDIRHTVVELYRTKYCEANFRHDTELLAEREGICISVSSVSKILEAEYILSPKVTKAKRKRIKKELLAKKENASSKKDAGSIQANLAAVGDAHSRRPRCACFGEMQQMDAAPYEWLPGQVWHLHRAIDDATGACILFSFNCQRQVYICEKIRDCIHRCGHPFRTFPARPAKKFFELGLNFRGGVPK